MCSTSSHRDQLSYFRLYPKPRGREHVSDGGYGRRLEECLKKPTDGGICVDSRAVRPMAPH